MLYNPLLDHLRQAQQIDLGIGSGFTEQAGNFLSHFACQERMFCTDVSRPMCAVVPVDWVLQRTAATRCIHGCCAEY